MVSEKHLYDAHERAHLPIPTYEEATSSRPPSQQSRLGPEEVSDDAERQGLLGHDSSREQSNSQRRNGGYMPPTVESARSSLDSSLGSLLEDDEEVELRQEMEEMDILDPESAEGSRRNRVRERFSKRFSRITNSLSAFQLPKIRWPSFGFGWLTSRIPSIPEQYRPGWSVIAKLCGLIIIITLVYLLVVSELVPIGNAGGLGNPFNPEWVRHTAQDNVEAGEIRENLRYITSYDHVAGTEGSFYLAQWIEKRFAAAHMDTLNHEEWYVYLNYPKPGKEGRRVAIVEPPALAWEASLDEEAVYDSNRAQTAAFHGLSKSGNVTGHLVYANYGSDQDFKWLKEKGVDVKGAIVLVRYYGTQTDPALKVKAAQDAGAAGVLIYSDPAEDGFIKGEPWPKGPWMPTNGVQRGSVALSGYVIGDVLTPGNGSSDSLNRKGKENNPGLPAIPSLPLAWRDAQALLKALKGHGHVLNGDWVGGVPLNDEWWTGDAKSPKVNLMNLLDEVDHQRIYNAFGSFKGLEEKAKKVVVGNHRDSWCFGAVDPGSGTAVMLEVARVIGELRAIGWRPLRTIEFASWDGGEYNMIGSTEHVEGNLNDLRDNALAYINVDVGVAGNELYANGSPILNRAWLRVLDRVGDPLRNLTLRELWDQRSGRLEPLAADGDYVAFQDIAGCSSIDFGFRGKENAFPYHSCYETYEWMEKFGDQNFEYHQMLAQVLVLLILELAQEPIVPLSLDDYAEALQNQITDFQEWAAVNAGDFEPQMMNPIATAVKELGEKAAKFHSWEDYWYSQVYGSGGFETNMLTMKRIEHNARMSDFETNLLDEHGIPGREQFKHAIYGPDISGSRYEAAVFPFIRDAFVKGDLGLAKKQIQKTADIIRQAGEKLIH